jgi:multidrug resistance protein MdtO
MNWKVNERVPLSELIRQELLPFHGRLSGSLRTTLAVVVTAVAMMVFRTPAVAPGVYLIFLISYETPYLTFTSGLLSLLFQCIGVAAALLLVVATDNAPIARVLGTALFCFLSAYMLRTMRRRGGMDFGVFSLTSLALWDMHLPADQLVRLSIWPVATGALGVLTAVAIEYAFARRDPFYALHKEFEVRLMAIENYLRAYSGQPDALHPYFASRKVVRLSFAGQGRMMALLDEIATRREGAEEYVNEFPVLLPHLFRLLDLAAALTLEDKNTPPTAERRARAQRLAEVCAELRLNPLASSPKLHDLVTAATGDDLISQMERTLAEIDSMEPHPPVSWQGGTRGAKPSPSWFVADAFSNPAYLAFSLKIALCGTISYIVYSALDWPGISTAVVTVLIVGLNTTGAISQKLIFRLIGSCIGAVLFGIGSIIFLFPHMDSIAGLAVLIAAVAFVASWVARAPHFSYIGLQIAFSFFLVTMSTFSAPVDMTPARDRLVGIGLALLLVWGVFLEIAPIRTVSEMRAALARVLANEAQLLALAETDPRIMHRSALRLREVITRDLVSVRSMSELVPYEFGTRADADHTESDQLLDASLATGSLFLALEAWLRGPQPAADARTMLAGRLTHWSHSLQAKTSTPASFGALEPRSDAFLPPRVSAAYSQLNTQLVALLRS